MAGTTWESTKKGARDLKRHVRKGTVVYTVRDVARSVAPYEDSQLYSAHVFDWRSPITGNWMTGHLSAEGLLAQEGRVYEQPPAGMRDIATPGRQVGTPLPENLGSGQGYSGVLDEAELRGLGKHIASGSDPRRRRLPNTHRP